MCNNLKNPKLHDVYGEGSAYCAGIMVFNLQIPAV